MGYPGPIQMKTEYTFLVHALQSAMQICGRARILYSPNILKAMERLSQDSYRKRAAYSHDQAVHNICQEEDVPVYCRGELLDEVDRYRDACIIEGDKVYPSMNVLISWLSHHYSHDMTFRAPDENQSHAYKRIKAGMKMKFRKNSSYQKGKLIDDYERIIRERGLREMQASEIAGEAGPLENYYAVAGGTPGTPMQLNISF
ncbi:MAG: hypothetical protein V1813_01100 [Candidatus Aenigmatarchaeota archaeon]